MEKITKKLSQLIVIECIVAPIPIDTDRYNRTQARISAKREVLGSRYALHENNRVKRLPAVKPVYIQPIDVIPNRLLKPQFRKYESDLYPVIKIFNERRK